MSNKVLIQVMGTAGCGKYVEGFISQVLNDEKFVIHPETALVMSRVKAEQIIHNKASRYSALTFVMRSI